MICRADAPGSTTGVCMEGVEPPQSCVNGPQRFDIRASEAFVMIGSRTGYIHPFVKDTASDACVIDPNLKDPKGYNLDLGWRGSVGDVLDFDIGVFDLVYHDRIGLISGVDSTGTRAVASITGETQSTTPNQVAVTAGLRTRF